MATTHVKQSQGLLFDLDTERVNGSAFKDPAFGENRSEAVHRWVPWIAGFSAGFVRDALDRYLTARNRKKRICIVDPFAGVGTTLLEGAKRGYSAIGFEINPYAAMAARTKLRSLTVDLGSFRAAISRFEQRVGAGLQRRLDAQPGPTSTPPSGFRTRDPFFSPKVEQKVLRVLDFIHTLRNPLIKDLFRVAFASVMVKFSNYSYEPSLTRRVSSGKSPIDDAPVSQIVGNKLREMEEDIAYLQTQATHANGFAFWEVYDDSCFASKIHVKARTVDLVITSPPYLNNYHYVRNTRPQAYWLGLLTNTKDFSVLERRSFGMFWQTVSMAALGFLFPSSSPASTFV